MLKRMLALFLIFTVILTQIMPFAFSHDGTLPSGTVAGPSSGDTASPEDPPPPDKEGGKGDQTGDTDPTLLHQGDFRYEARDLLIPSRGIPLEIKRTYRSRSRYNAMFGYGWDFNFNLRLRKRSNGDVVILTGDNRRNEFKKVGAIFQAPPGIYDTLTQNGDGSFNLKKKHGELYVFDVNGKLVTMSDRNGNTMTFAYDPNGKLPVTGTSPYFVGQSTGIVVMDYRLIQITDTVGRNIDLFYNSSGRLEKIKDFTGRVLIYQYSAAGDLISFGEVPPGGLLPGETLMGYKTTYTYTNHNLETITDAKGKTYLQNVYNTEDRVIQQTYGDLLESGGTSIISYEPLANQTTVTDRKGFQTIWTFNDDGNPVRKEVFTDGIRPGDPVSFVTLYEYNTNLELTKITYPKGNITENQYDSKGNLLEVRRKGQGGNPDIVTTFTYEPQFNLIKTITDPRQNVTTYTYDYELAEPAKGNLRKITFPQVDAETIEAVFTYNASGQIETAEDPNHNVTKYEYFPATGYLQKLTQGFGAPEASVTEFLLYDDVGNLKELKDPRGNITQFTYDVNNNLKQVTAPAPFSFLTKYTYDANGNLEKVERQSNTAGTTFQTTTYTYTVLDQLKTITDNATNITTFEYDANGNRKKIIDAELKATNYLYDERDLLFTVADAETAVTAYGYDLNGNLASIKDANTNTTTYLYDEFDRLKEMTYPDNSTESYTYDAASNLKTKQDPKSQLITYDYDELNRLTFKTYNGCAVSVCGGNVDYVYDPCSRLKTVSNSLATINYPLYDALNRVKQVTTTLNSTNFVVGYQYDGTGNRTQLTYPHGRIVKYDYDELNRLNLIKNSLDQVLYDFGYDTLSRRDSLSRPNGVTTNYSYDTINRLTEIGTVPAFPGTVPISYPLYDKVGNRKQMTNSQGTRDYTYNNRYELTSSVIASVSEAIYAYDPVGNRTTVTETGTPSSYTPNNLNQYTSVDGTAFTYDANGNLTNDGDQIYEYDYENRLIRVTPAPPNTSLRGSAATEAIYAYDPFGRRLSSSLRGGAADEAISYLYDGDQIIETYPCDLTAGTCSLSQSFLFGPSIDEPLELTDHPSLTKHYYHQDGLGSVTQITDSIGAVQESYFYSPYGIPEIRDASNTIIPESSIGNPFLFTGREYDNETGLYFSRNRYYSPPIGRFISRDTFSPFIEAPESLNRYKYAFNNPSRFVDPLGDHPAAIATVGIAIIVVGTTVGAVIGGVEAYRAGESITIGVGRGAVQGAAGSIVGAGVGLLTQNPALIGASASLAASYAGQRFDRAVLGKQIDPSSVVFDTIAGAILGPYVSKAVPLRGRVPDLLKPRTFSELFKPNSIRLYKAEALAALYDFLLGEVTAVPEAEGGEIAKEKTK